MMPLTFALVGLVASGLVARRLRAARQRRAFERAASVVDADHLPLIERLRLHDARARSPR